MTIIVVTSGKVWPVYTVVLPFSAFTQFRLIICDTDGMSLRSPATPHTRCGQIRSLFCKLISIKLGFLR